MNEPARQSAPLPRRMTVEEYFAFTKARESGGVRYEYDHGVVRAMAGGSPNHSRLKVRLNALIFNLLDSSGSDCELFDADLRVQMSEDGRYTYPDATLACEQPTFVNNHTLTNPTVIFEVLSPGNREYDRHVKRERYFGIPSVQAVVLVDSESMRVESFGRPSSEGIIPYRSVSQPEATFTVPGLEAAISLGELYRGIDLPEQIDPMSEIAAAPTGESDVSSDGDRHGNGNGDEST